MSDGRARDTGLENLFRNLVRCATGRAVRDVAFRNDPELEVLPPNPRLLAEPVRRDDPREHLRIVDTLVSRGIAPRLCRCTVGQLSPEPFGARLQPRIRWVKSRIQRNIMTIEHPRFPTPVDERRALVLYEALRQSAEFDQRHPGYQRTSGRRSRKAAASYLARSAQLILTT